MSSVAGKFFFDHRIIEEVLELAPLGPKLEQIVAAASEAPPGSTFNAVVEHVAKKLNMPEEAVGQVLTTLQNICRLQGRMKLTPAQMLEVLTTGVETYAKTIKENDILRVWQTFSGLLLQVLKGLGPEHPLSIARKTERIFYAHQNLLNDVRIITDLRPIFDKAGKRVVRMMVSQSLLIDYTESNQSRRFEVALDAADLADLRRACERAQVKAVALKEAMKDGPWITALGLEDTEEMETRPCE